MKKRSHKLTLTRETVRHLCDAHLGAVQGGKKVKDNQLPDLIGRTQKTTK